LGRITTVYYDPQEVPESRPQTFAMDTPRPSTLAEDLAEAQRAAAAAAVPDADDSAVEEAETADEGVDAESAEEAEESAEALNAAESSIAANVDDVLDKTEQILRTGQPAFINIATRSGTIALQISTNMLNFLVRNRETILGAALLMHTIENNPSISSWLPGWNLEILNDPIANTQRLIDQMQSMGVLDVLTNLGARLRGRTLSSEQAHLAMLMGQVTPVLRALINKFARFAVRAIGTFVATEMIGPLSAVNFALQMAWAVHQRRINIMNEAASGAVSTIMAGMVGGPAAAAMAAATSFGQAVQKVPPTPFPLPIPSALPMSSSAAASSSSSSPAAVPSPQQPPALQRQLGEVRSAQEQREADAMANPDRRPTTVAAERGATRRDRPRGKVPSATTGILPSENMDTDIDGSINDFTRRLKALDGDPDDRASRALIESRSDWTNFARWLRSQTGSNMKSWNAFANMWHEYKQSRDPAASSSSASRAEARPARGRFGGYAAAPVSGSGAPHMETPESLHLQPKAKAKTKAKAKARGGSRPPAKGKVKKVELSKPVLPYHDIMNDRYYVKA
jgi:hypothetical protein